PRPGSLRRRARPEDAPQAPWAPLPLTELCILVGLVILVFGFFSRGPDTAVLIGAGVGLVALGTVEFTVREHFAGYRSHTTLLAATLGMAAMGALYLLDVIGAIAPLAVGVVVAGLAWRALREAFRRRTGGLSFRA
ncbi:MAG: hypothetical protein M3459_05705, partial [Actinomycetota bacterium]|nr:hypothetical protein [Actinomycetota bacterium]